MAKSILDEKLRVPIEGMLRPPKWAVTVKSRALADLGASGASENRVCSHHGYSVGAAAAGTGLRLGHDDLETAARLASGRRVGPTALVAFRRGWARASVWICLRSMSSPLPFGLSGVLYHKAQSHR
jgi:hypothetical protein